MIRWMSGLLAFRIIAVSVCLNTLKFACKVIYNRGFFTTFAPVFKLFYVQGAKYRDVNKLKW